MSGFRWIEISSFLILLLHLTAVTGRYSFIAVRDGDEVTLSCEDVIQDQDKCDSTTWLFADPRRSAAVALVELGRIKENATSKSDRLSVISDCSLVIKKVTVEDVGQYTCRQFKSGRQHCQDAVVELSLINLTEHKDTDKVTLSCSVSTHKGCTYRVEWLSVVHPVDEDNKDVKTSQSHCSATVTFTTLHLAKSNYYELFKCKVTDGYHGNVQLFTISPLSSGEKSALTDCSALNYITLVICVAVLVLTTVIIGLLIRARGNQRPPDDDTVLNSVRSRTVKRSGAAASQVHKDEDDDTVNYENCRGPSVSRLH